MRTTVTLDDELLKEASEAIGTTERAVVLREGLRALIEREAARRPILLGGTMPGATLAPRRRSTPAPAARRSGK